MKAKVTHETRGRTMGAYRVADMGASLVAQLMIGVLEPASYVSYNILAILCCASLLPLTLTKVPAPETPEAPRLRPGLAWRCSPLATLGVVIAALSGATFRMVGPVYGQQVGLELDQIAYFLAAFVLGGAIAQVPVGWLSDRYDRRGVLIWLSVAAAASCGITVALGGISTSTVMMTACLFGMTSFPIYSVSAAHAHDFADSSQRVELSAALMFYFAVGAIAAPLVASALMDVYGPYSMFGLIAAGHALLILYGLWRMRIRATRKDRTRYIWSPRTSFEIGKLTGEEREADSGSDKAAR
jgi:MFS family permease